MPNNGGFKSIFFGSTAIFGYTLQLKGKKKKIILFTCSH